MKCTSDGFKWETRHDDFIIQKKKEITFSDTAVSDYKAWKLIASTFNAAFKENFSHTEIKSRFRQQFSCRVVLKNDKIKSEKDKADLFNKFNVFRLKKNNEENKKITSSQYSWIMINQKEIRSSEDDKKIRFNRCNMNFIDQTIHYQNKCMRFIDQRSQFLNLEENKCSSKEQASTNSNKNKEIVISDTNLNLDWFEIEQVDNSNQNQRRTNQNNNDTVNSDPAITCQENVLSNTQPVNDLNFDEIDQFFESLLHNK